MHFPHSSIRRSAFSSARGIAGRRVQTSEPGDDLAEDQERVGAVPAAQLLAGCRPPRPGPEALQEVVIRDGQVECPHLLDLSPQRPGSERDSPVVEGLEDPPAMGFRSGLRRGMEHEHHPEPAREPCELRCHCRESRGRVRSVANRPRPRILSRACLCFPPIGSVILTGGRPMRNGRT